MEFKTKNKTALVFGYTGLIGGQLTRLLLEDERYSKIKVFVRRPVRQKHSKLEVILTDYEDLPSVAPEISGDELFCCLGTTMKKAGSRTAFAKVDLDYPVQIAEIASTNKVAKYLVVSSIGASKNSTGFYLRTKGIMEEAMKKYEFRQLAIFRPSLLLGTRNDKRWGEDAGKWLYGIIGFLFRGPLAKYRAIEGVTVARAMINVANNLPGQVVYESDAIQKIGQTD
jgi:uncharacterized protein YbjT (DUF2867 family)